MSGFHEAFAQALLAPAPQPDGPLATLGAHPAFAVYRNTVMKGCIDALEANFPALARLVGSEWLRSAAAQYVRGHPPVDARLLLYGDEGFGAFVQALPSAQGLPYLAGVARLDTLWREAHVAADAAVLQPAALAALAPEALGGRVLAPHPAARWAWFDDAPVASVWARNRGEGADDTPLDWQGEGLLFTRPAGAVQWQPLAHAGCAFLDTCAQGGCLAEAAAQALARDPRADLAALLAQLLGAGAFTEALSPGEPT